MVNPTRFSNQYFKLLLRDIWKPRQWDGPFQYEATVAGTKLMMLPTDVRRHYFPLTRTRARTYPPPALPTGAK